MRNGPALFKRGSRIKRHLFDGDGFAQAWDFNKGTIRHRAAWIQTSKFREEQHEGRFLYPGLADPVTTYKAIRTPDDFNTANTNLIGWNHRLLALWEAGSAYELDPQSLQTIGPVTWSPETQSAPFGAHPKLDESGSLWNVGVSGGKLLIYVIHPDGRPVKTTLHAIRPCALVHDFILTKRFLAVWLAPIQLEPEIMTQNGSLLSAMQWKGDEGSHLVLIDRGSLEILKTIQLDSELVFHFANAWEDDKYLNICYIRSAVEQLFEGLIIPQSHEAPMPSQRLRSRACFRRISLKTGRSELITGDEAAEFPQFDERLRGKPDGTFFALISCMSNSLHTFNGIARYALPDMHMQQWLGGEEIELEEHVYVPKQSKNPSSGGWLVGTGYDAKKNKSFCSAFDADRLDDGPLSMVYLNAPTPICFHGQFLDHV